MEIKIDLNRLARNNLTPNQGVLLYLMYKKQWDTIRSIFSIKQAKQLRNSLLSTKFLLIDSSDIKVTETIVSNENVCKLFNIRADKINFIEFYNIYPIRVGNRILRAATLDTVLGKKHEKRYLAKITTIEDHEKAKAATELFINKQRVAGSLPYLPNIETVINNAMWEQWEVFKQKEGEESSSWNTETI